MNALHCLMSHLKTAQIRRDERGVAALEYALIAGLVGLVMAAGATTLGTNLSTFFATLANKVKALPVTR